MSSKIKMSIILGKPNTSFKKKILMQTLQNEVPDLKKLKLAAWYALLRFCKSEEV